MDPITLWLQVVDKGLTIWLIILQDIPKERREEGWKRFFDFWDRVASAFPKPPQEHP